ncbi:MAG: hypothetical protein ABIR57_01895, partial [Aeromicrobium sp.]
MDPGIAAAEGVSGVGAAKLFAGRYDLGETLKHGNGVDTFRAIDTLSGRDVVVKAIEPETIHAAARLRFEHETQVLRHLTGTGLTGLCD